jgi:biopolymer transport protein ExbD
MSASAGQGEGKLEVNLTPLLDLVLQLIMFFMLTVNFVRIDQVSDEVVLPVVQTAMPIRVSADDFVYVSINKDDTYLSSGKRLFNKETVEKYVRQRKQELDGIARARAEREGKKYSALTSGTVGVVRAHKDASWGAVDDVLQAFVKAGYTRHQLRVLKQAA